MRLASKLPRLAAGSIAAFALTLAGLGEAKSPILQPDRLVLISTSDVKAKTGPCGCSTPKGGLARRASYIDSVKTSYGQVMVVDNGSYFPEEGDEYQDAASFMIDAMKTLNLDAVNVGELDLKYGREFLESRVKSAKLPVVSANLLNKATHKPVFQPYLIKKIGRVNVGVVGLISKDAKLGPSTETLEVADPVATAQKIVPEMRAKGAQVVVLLSQLGKTETEDLVSNADGIDAAMAGRNVLVVQKGRLVKNTVVCYGGEQGQYACRTEISLDAKGKLAAGQAETVMLGPAVGDQAAMQALVKTFDATFNEKLRKLGLSKPADPHATQPAVTEQAPAPKTLEAPPKTSGS